MSQYELASTRLEVADALEAIEMFYQKGWTDGLPVVPPTEKRVLEFLECCGRRPDEVIGTVPTRNRIIIAEKVAINAIMAGCLPAYAPVVVAAVEAISDDRYNLHATAASTGGAAPLIIVSGPVARELGINGGVNALGPGWRANATIGRALRLVLMNLCGAKPGVLDKSTFGHPGKYSYCMAENESSSPWEPLRVDMGFPEDVSTVTVVAAEGPHQVGDRAAYEPRELLDTFADAMSTLANFAKGDWVVVVSPEHAAVIARHRWSRADVKDYLVERAGRPLADLKRVGRVAGGLEAGDEQRFVPLLSGPGQIVLLVAGGEAGNFSLVIPPWTGGGSRAVTRAIGVCFEC